jgi:hypothetical protein
MNSTKIILIGGILILSIGAINAAIDKKPETPVIAGSIGVILLASLLDALGPTPGKIAAAFVGLAATTVVFVEAPSLFTALQNAQKQSVSKK